MTQGNGSGNEQPQWGVPEQNSQQPQWGQATPSPDSQPAWNQAPAASSFPAAAYPGASGYAAGPGAAQGGGTRSRAAKLGITMVILSVVAILARLVTPIFMFIIAGAGNPAYTDDISVGMGLSSLGTLMSWAVNTLCTIALLVLAIISAIQFRQRARVGAIIVIATVVLSTPLYWIASLITGLIVVAVTAGGSDPIAATYVASGIVEIVRLLLVAAAMIIGSYLVMMWGRQKA